MHDRLFVCLCKYYWWHLRDKNEMTLPPPWQRYVLSECSWYCENSCDGYKLFKYDVMMYFYLQSIGFE